MRGNNLQSKRLQYESAMAGLQSRSIILGARRISRDDLCSALHSRPSRSVLPRRPRARCARCCRGRGPRLPTGLRVRSDPGDARRAFTVCVGALASRGPARGGGLGGVVSRGAPPRRIRRRRQHPFVLQSETPPMSLLATRRPWSRGPHGHILRSGNWRWVDPEQFGTTCYAAGIFSAQAYLGNPDFRAPSARSSERAGHGQGIGPARLS